MDLQALCKYWSFKVWTAVQATFTSIGRFHRVDVLHKPNYNITTAALVSYTTVSTNVQVESHI